MTSNQDKVLRENIEKRTQKWDEYAKQKDWAGLMNNLFSANAKIVTPAGETIVGKEAIQAFYGKNYESPAFPVCKVEEVNGEGDWAYARGTYKLTDGKAEADSGKFVTVWKKAKNEFEVHAAIWNSSKKA